MGLRQQELNSCVACEILSHLVGSFKPKDIAISPMASEKDCYTKYATRVARQNPLIEACYYSEAKDARVPGSEVSLNLCLNYLPRPGEELKRLVHAACLCMM